MSQRVFDFLTDSIADSFRNMSSVSDLTQGTKLSLLLLITRQPYNEIEGKNNPVRSNERGKAVS